MGEGDYFVLLVFVPLTMAFQVGFWPLLIGQVRLKRRQVPLAKDGNPFIPASMMFLVGMQYLIFQSVFEGYSRWPRLLALVGIFVCFGISYVIYRGMRGTHWHDKVSADPEYPEG